MHVTQPTHNTFFKKKKHFVKKWRKAFYVTFSKARSQNSYDQCSAFYPTSVQTRIEKSHTQKQDWTGKIRDMDERIKNKGVYEQPQTRNTLLHSLLHRASKDKRKAGNFFCGCGHSRVRHEDFRGKYRRNGRQITNLKTSYPYVPKLDKKGWRSKI